MPDVGAIVGATVFTGGDAVNVIEPLPVLELVLSVGDVDGRDPGVKVELTPD